MSIKAFKLTSGEDIISEVLEETSNDVTLKNPAAIIVQQTSEGRVGAAFVPFTPFAKNNIVVIYKTAIAGHMEIDVKLMNEYSRIFGSGIMIASADEMPRMIL